MFISIPYSIEAKTVLLSMLSSSGEPIATLDVRWNDVSPEAIFSYPVPENVAEFLLDGVPITPVLTEDKADRIISDPYPMPRLTFTPPMGWNNDPNGLFYLDGVWHMFYQHNPAGAVWGNMHWAHAVSSDLVHWEDRGLTLFPDDMGTMFSGSAIVDFENASGLGNGTSPAVLLFYTAAGNTNPASRGKYFTQCLAYSTDGGNTFTKYENNPVIGPVSPSTRDPKVVRDGKGGYLLGLYEDEPDHKYLLFTSTDLIHWNLTDRFKLGDDSECPDLYPLEYLGDTHWIYSGASDFYAICNIENGNFICTSNEPDRMSLAGTQGYAAQTWSDAPGGRRVKTWWNRWEGIPEKGVRRCSMGAPCDISLKEINGELKLCADIVPEIYSAFANKTTLLPGKGEELTEADTFLLEADASNGLELIIRGEYFSIKGNEISLGDKKYLSPLPIEKLTVFADGLNLQILAANGAVNLLLAQIPQGKTASLVRCSGEITVYTL